MKTWPADMVLGFAVATVLLSSTLYLARCSPAQPAAVDLAAYTADQMACVEREPSETCHQDRAACRARIDACRAQVKARYQDAGAP